MLAEQMVSPEAQPAEMNPSVPPQSSGGGRRRGRRGGRGRRRGSRRSAPTRPTDQTASIPAEAATAAPSEISGAGHGGKASPAIHQAIDEIRQIVESLEQVLEQMEEVRELIERAEHQQSADEREIESLRRALRRIQEPRGHKDAPHDRHSD